jgi:hypothetical protein
MSLDMPLFLFGLVVVFTVSIIVSAALTAAGLSILSLPVSFAIGFFGIKPFLKFTYKRY